MSKRVSIVLLVGLNFVLASALILLRWDLPAAKAQPTPLAQNFVMVAGEIRANIDALYIIDLANRRLHAFVPLRGFPPRGLVHSGYRDLVKDFR